MLLDEVLVVFVHRATTHHPDLAVPTHHLAIDVESGLLIANQSALLFEPLQSGLRLRIDRVMVRVGVDRKVYLGPNDMEKAVGVSRGQIARFGRGDHIVGHTGHPLGQVGSGSQRRERANECQGFLLQDVRFPGQLKCRMSRIGNSNRFATNKGFRQGGIQALDID